MKNENKVEQKKKKAAYDKEYRARKKFLDEIEKTEEFVVSCREKCCQSKQIRKRICT